MTITDLISRIRSVAALMLTVVAVAACSSSSDAKISARTQDRATSTSSTTSSPTTAAAPPPPCTTDAATAAMSPGNRALGIECSDRWASGPYTTGIIEAAYLAQANGSSWRILDPSEFGHACARGNPERIPANVLRQSPCGVS